MAKLAFWITAGPELADKALAGIVLATRLKQNRGQDVEVYLFGPGVKFAGEAQGDARAKFMDLIKAEVPVGVCPANAESYGVKEILESEGYIMEPAGEALIRLNDSGYQIVGY